MYRTTIWLISVISSVLFRANGFSLFDSQTSYAQFQRWPANRENRIRVSFRFKTYARTGLLLYADDEGDAQYLKVALRNGVLVLELSDGNEIFVNATDSRVNDLQWHWIRFEVTPGYHVVCKLDDLTVGEYNLSTFALKSHVYIGGLPKTMDILILTNIQALLEARFLGCILDVRYENGSTVAAPANLTRSSDMSAECKNACKAPNPCRNHGVCVNKFAMAECLCTGTGYRGEICQQELPPVGIPNPYDRVIVGVSSGPISRLEATSLLIRFRSAKPDGVFFYTAYKGDYILLELTNGKVSTSVNLGSGSVTIATKTGGYDDNRWHAVKLERFKRTVNLTVDSSDVSQGETQGNFSQFSLPDSKTSFVLGGLSNSQLKLKSVSGRNFTGCLQELIFNDHELFSKLHAKADGVRGAIVPTCPEVKQASTQAFQESSSIRGTSATISTTVETGSTNTTTKNMSTLGSIPAQFKSDGVALSTPPVETTTRNADIPSSSCPPNVICAGSPSRLTTTGPSRSTAIVQIASNEQASMPTPSTEHTGSQYHSQNTEPRITKKPGSSRDERRTTKTIMLASSNERKEKDMTLWFVLAAGIAVVAIILAICIIIKVNSANRMKYKMKNSRYKSPVSDGGSFLKSSGNRKDLV